MPEDEGRIDWMPRLKAWRVIKYVGSRDVRVGDYETQEEAGDALRTIVYGQRPDEEEMGDIQVGESSSYSFEEVVNAALGGDKRAQSYLSRNVWGESWTSIKLKLRMMQRRGGATNEWFTEGNDRHTENYLAGRVYVP